MVYNEEQYKILTKAYLNFVEDKNIDPIDSNDLHLVIIDDKNKLKH